MLGYIKTKNKNDLISPICQKIFLLCCSPKKPIIMQQTGANTMANPYRKVSRRLVDIIMLK